MTEMGSAGEELALNQGWEQRLVPGVAMAALGMNDHLLAWKQRFLLLQPNPLMGHTPWFSQGPPFTVVDKFSFSSKKGPKQALSQAAFEVVLCTQFIQHPTLQTETWSYGEMPQPLKNTLSLKPLLSSPETDRKGMLKSLPSLLFNNSGSSLKHIGRTIEEQGLKLIPCPVTQQQCPGLPGTLRQMLLPAV